MQSTTLAYLAGLLDGEGYVGIKRTKRKDAASAIFHERIQIRMVDEAAIALFAKMLGGNYYFERKATPGRRALYCYQASDAKAASIARMLLPYLRVKRRSALNLLRLRDSKNDPRARKRGSPARRTMNASILAFRERLYERAKRINHGTE